MTIVERSSDTGTRGAMVWSAIAVAVLNLASTIYLNWRGIVELEGVGVYSFFTACPIFVLSLVLWAFSRGSRKTTPNWGKVSTAYWLIVTANVAIFVLYPIRFYV